MHFLGYCSVIFLTLKLFSQSFFSFSVLTLVCFKPPFWDILEPQSTFYFPNCAQIETEGRDIAHQPTKSSALKKILLGIYGELCC